MKRRKERSHRGSPHRSHSRNSIRHRHTIYTGKVQKKPAGFAFIIPAAKHALRDVYVPREVASELLNGDEVAFSLQTDRGRQVAHIEKILKRAVTQVVGQILNRDHIRSIDEEIYRLTEVVTHSDIGQWVTAKIEKYPKGEKVGEVSIINRLGAEITPKHDLLITRAKFSLPESFSEGVLAYLPEAHAKMGPALKHLGKRRDLRSHSFVTIDGSDAKDFDDAICVETHTGHHAYTLYVAIADVSFFVEPGSAVDEEAYSRSTSVYLPGTVIPMLPEFLSNDLCSLRPEQDRFCLTAEIRYDSRGTVLSTQFYESLIKTIKRLTYEEAQQLMVTGGEGVLAEMIGNANRLFRVLRKLRKERGVLEFLLPEGKVELGKEGEVTALSLAPHFDAHELIEEFMIAANRAVASALTRNHVGALHRIHEPPDPEDAQRVEQLAKALGAPAKLDPEDPRSFARLLEATRNSPFREALHKTMLRAQKQARYSPEPLGHFGLALRDYCHFTSPIRRYPDLIVHRALKRLINSQNSADVENEGHSLTEAGEQTSQLERRAMEAERFIVRRKQCWFFKRHLGAQLEGRITDITETGVFVEIPEWGADGYIPSEGLSGNYRYDESRLRLVAKGSKQSITIGHKIRVQVVAVDIAGGRVTFREVK